MTERKSFKRRVRARMEKTGERYTAARRHVEAAARATGRTQEEWFAILDAWGAADRPHREIAAHLREQHGVGGWWAQSLTVEYERARGLRQKHQRSDGTFYAAATKTVGVPVERLYEAFLGLDGLRLRTAQPPRSARFDWEDGTTRVHAAFTAKDDAKSTVALEHEKLTSAEEVERWKAYWRARLEEVKRELEAR